MTCKYNETIALKHGINSAIIASFLWDELQKSKYFYAENKYWVKCSQKKITGVFPFFGEKAVRNALRRLTNSKILVRKKINYNPYDHTFSYAFTSYGKTLMVENDIKSDKTVGG